jgi:hypothetical protein
MHLVIVKEYIMRKGNKTKTEIIIAFSVLLFGAAIFLVIVEVMSDVLVF